MLVIDVSDRQNLSKDACFQFECQYPGYGDEAPPVGQVIKVKSGDVTRLAVVVENAFPSGELEVFLIDTNQGWVKIEER